MQLEERFFSTHLFLPRTKHYISERGKLFIALTPWGSNSYPEKDVFEELDSSFHFLESDKDSTQPFPKLMSLTQSENHLRSAIIQTNKSIYDQANHSAYSCGFEMLVIYATKSICTLVQIGSLSVLLDRPKQDLHLTGYFQHLNAPLNPKWNAPPLPSQLLGIHPDISFHPVSFTLKREDSLILLQRQSEVPHTWLKTETRDLKSLSQLAAEDNPHKPFWLAHLKLNG